MLVTTALRSELRSLTRWRSLSLRVLLVISDDSITIAYVSVLDLASTPVPAVKTLVCNALYMFRE